MADVDVECAFIASVRTVDDFMWAQAHGVDARLFKEAASIWAWVAAYVARSQALPPRELIERQFTNFVPPLAVGDVRHHHAELRKAHVARTLRGTIFQNAESIDTDPLGALNNIIAGLIDVQRSESPNFSYYDRDAHERVVALEERKRKLTEGVSSGIPTGIEIIDIQKYGWQPGEFSAFIARPGAGKSELLALSAVSAWAAGKRVLVVSSEMTREKFMLRMDPILARQRGIPLPEFPSNRALLSGNIPADHVAAYARFTASLTGTSGMLVMDQQGRRKPITMAEVALVARNHRADLVIIDGLKLLGAANERSSGIERYQGIIKDCHDLAQSDGMVVLGAEHTARDVESNKMPDMNQIYNGEAIPQFAERIITMMVPTGIQKQRFIAVQKARDGGAVPRRKAISFDPDIGDVGRWIDPLDVKLQSELAEFMTDAPVTGAAMYAVEGSRTELDLS